MATAIICLILLVICIFGVRSTIKRTKYGCCGGSGDDVKKIKVNDKDPSHYPYKSTLGIDGMTCNNCKKKIENAFNSEAGVYCIVDLNKKQATIHMKDKLEETVLKDIVRKAGYFPIK